MIHYPDFFVQKKKNKNKMRTQDKQFLEVLVRNLDFLHAMVFAFLKKKKDFFKSL